MMASEMGVLPAPEDKIVEKWRLQPGKMLMIDLEQGRIISDAEIKAELPPPIPTGMVGPRKSSSKTCPPEGAAHVFRYSPARPATGFWLYARGFEILFPPMIERGEEGTGSMGTDTPISALSDKSAALYLFQTEFRASHQPAN